MEIDYSELQSSIKATLNQRVATVTFKKVNGDLRVMECTTNLDKVPPSQWPKESTGVKTESKAIRVFDVKAQGWRSFLIENFISIN